MSVEVGQIVEGTVTGITHFGAFVELSDGRTGLVHISEVADVYVKDINEHLQRQEKVKVKVLSMDANGKIGLSIKQAERSFRRRGQSKILGISFEDKMSRFLKESDERQHDLKKKLDFRRGGRGQVRVKDVQ